MNKKILSVVALIFPLMLSSCNSNSENNFEVFDEETFNSFKVGSLKIKGESVTSFINQTTGDKVDIASESEVLFSDGAYSFHEKYEQDLVEETSANYFKNDDGYAVGKFLTIENEVSTNNVVISGTDQKVVFDEYYANPFNYLQYSDLVYNQEDNSFKIEDNEVGERFTNPIAFNNEKFYSFTLKYENSELIGIYQGRTSKYSVKSIFTFVKTDEVVKDVVPYKHESFHDNIAKAMEKMANTTNFTYRRTRQNIDNENEITTLYSKITENAILYPADEFTAHTTPYGTAKFDDGNIYGFEIDENNNVVKYENPVEEEDRPIFNTCAPEFFIETDTPNVYRLDNYDFSCLTAAYMSETLDERTLIMMMGLTGNLIIEVEGDNLVSFSYVLTRIYETTMKTEINTVYIEDINNTVIPYEFKITA